MFSGPDSMRLCSLCTFQPVCYVGGFGDLGDPVVPTLRGVSGNVVTAYERTFFLQSVALPRASQSPCQRHKMTVSTNNGLHE